MKYLFFGMGYSSLATARYLQKHIGENIKISGTTRELEKTKQLKNIKSFIFDGLKPSENINSEINEADFIIHSIAPDENGDAVYNYFFDELKNAKNLKWLCYLSTVGVYGNHNGLWIDESAKCEPKNIRSQYRLKAEKQWREFAEQKGLPLLILRLAGIYGQGRSSFDKLKAGTAKRIVKKNQVFNRIHVKDIARVISLASEKKLNGTFNLCDDEPAPPQDVVSFASNISGLPAPKEILFEEAKMSKMAKSFYNDNKKISNEAIKKALNIELLYANYRIGLKAIHQQSLK